MSKVDMESDDVDYFTWNYVKPWCRFSPYIIGMVVGYILHVTKNKPLKLNPVIILDIELLHQKVDKKFLHYSSL